MRITVRREHAQADTQERALRRRARRRGMAAALMILMSTAVVVSPALNGPAYGAVVQADDGVTPTDGPTQDPTQDPTQPPRPRTPPRSPPSRRRR